MGYLIESANASPPVEIMILDYNSPDNLADYIKQVLDSKSLNPENILSYCKYQGQNYYHMAHARNLSVRASSGSIITIMSSDICPQANFVSVIREQIKNYDCLLGVGMTFNKSEDNIPIRLPLLNSRNSKSLSSGP